MRIVLPILTLMAVMLMTLHYQMKANQLAREAEVGVGATDPVLMFQMAQNAAYEDDAEQADAAALAD